MCCRLPSSKDKFNSLLTMFIAYLVLLDTTGRSIKNSSSQTLKMSLSSVLLKSAVAEIRNRSHQILFDSASVVAQSRYYVQKKS